MGKKKATVKSSIILPHIVFYIQIFKPNYCEIFKPRTDAILTSLPLLFLDISTYCIGIGELGFNCITGLLQETQAQTPFMSSVSIVTGLRFQPTNNS